MYPQLRKSLSAVTALLEREEFEIEKTSLHVGSDTHLLVELSAMELPRTRKHRGPPVRSENVDEFLAKWSTGGVSAPYRGVRLRSRGVDDARKWGDAFLASGRSGVAVVAGDTKVVRRGEGGGLYLSVAGIGVKRAQAPLDIIGIAPGDVVLVSGPVGDHGIAVMLAREQFGLSGELRSDSASVLPLTQAVRDLSGLRFMRDPTRGGLATVAHEIARACGHNVTLEQREVPLRPEVVSVCEMLGYDPYYLACEGRVVAVADAATANEILTRWQTLPEGKAACIIGRVEAGDSRVILETELGGRRILDELEDDPLPRIC